MERILKLKGVKLIFDLDDAIYSTQIDEISNKKNKFIYKLKYGKRFDVTIKIADLVICGNKYILEYCGKLNSNCIVIPTTVDTNKIQMKKHFNKDINNITIGWIGNPGNTKYVTDILNELDEVARINHIKIKFNMIGAKKFDSSRFENLDINFLEWNLETEYNNLRECDLGIMPLNDSEWSKGKCGLKLLQYMAVGMTAIANDVGCNKDIIIEGENGYLVSKNVSWQDAVNKYIENIDKSEEMGKFARKFVEENYSINSVIEKLEKVLNI